MKRTVIRMMDEAAANWATVPYAFNKGASGWVSVSFKEARGRSREFAAWLVSMLWRRSGRGFGAASLSAAAGNLTILACGALWLGALTHISAQLAVTLAVVPFLPGDALKVVAAAALAAGLNRLRRKDA